MVFEVHYFFSTSFKMKQISKDLSPVVPRFLRHNFLFFYKLLLMNIQVERVYAIIAILMFYFNGYNKNKFSNNEIMTFR